MIYGREITSDVCLVPPPPPPPLLLHSERRRIRLLTVNGAEDKLGTEKQKAFYFFLNGGHFFTFSGALFHSCNLI
jgi:hypothetical protein